ncbi:hypothetical protein K9N68_04085 [Kovacikia minuta CCNUW1]|uniref:hypothetical protein n=1 Tax=Kovacikia minuta TaxID=2931930 RepID=UPI001CCA619B|nr:hypothetical protein [Kovacikia minuta]UBF27154.1 hypothetical protein K9N68_04085 [Kovacikia minuta CCNUW1]
MQAFEATGTINTAGRLTLDQPLKIPHPGRIRLIVLVEESGSNPASSQLVQTETEASSESASNQLSFDPDAQPIWELVAEISAQVPDEEWAKLPTDLARNFDKYQKQRNDE